MIRNKRFIVICSAALILGSCKEENKRESTDKVIPVKVTEIVVTETADRRSYVGTVEESAAISLSFSMPGTVEEVFVSEGQHVRKGQLLATLNTATAENSYQGALAKLRQAQDAYDRLTKVHENGSLPDIKFVEVETGLQQAKSMAAVSKKSLEDCRLYAPRNGVITTRQIEPGMNIMPGMQALKLVTVETVFVKISVPEKETGLIARGQEAQVTVAALDNAVFTGKIEMKGMSANALTHTYEAKISITNPQYRLMPGMICRVTMFSGTEGNAEIVVPNRCIQISADGKKYVWLTDGHAARRRFVETGDLDDNGIVIVEGLSTGDKLITEGFQKVSEGMKILISN
ncbi:MAG: efflux RND transporter periplasmic adaptor subunit [Tannerella sp.]|jgi:RND family efflux transporter MFP subunit|nr:efflux RND transporter periplasmic adaptor subunit [Tannerella sp.]